MNVYYYSLYRELRHLEVANVGENGKLQISHPGETI